ncbi:hypothetical protein ACFO3D_03670 [Virgibacillus kekensis]|uniref:Uncharacterized protein n=1 Tax=Virgibacillus kekensis TaxID=202261 RepID=A0ABV9DF20_9BACI
MLKSIFSFIQDKQKEANQRYTQRILDSWFKADHIFSEEVTPGTECIFETLTIEEPIKLVCDYNMPPFDSSKYDTYPAEIERLREYFSQEFGIAIYTDKTNQKLGYLPLLKNIETDLAREGSYKHAVHDLLKKNIKVYSKLVRVERNDNPIKPLRPKQNFHYPESRYVVELHINTDLEKLNKKVKERLQYLEKQRIEREKEAAIFRSTPKSTHVYDKDDYLDSRSVWDDYDEDGVPYEDYERDEPFNDDFLDDDTNDLKDEENSKEEISSRSDWDDYDEDGVPYEDYKK